MSDDITTVTGVVEVVEVIAPPYSITEVVGLDSVGLVEVRDIDQAVVDVPDAIVEVVEVQTAELVGPAGDVGPAGPAGPQGNQGVPGPAGPFAPLFEQHFAIPAYIWVINHGLDTYPVTTTVDLNEEEIVGDVVTPDRNTVVVTFAVPMAGTARLKA